MENQIYETEILSLMPYLQMHGLKFIRCKAKLGGERARIIAQFEDPRGVGSELAMAWNNSTEKQYRDWWTYFRDQIDRMIRGVDNAK